MQLMFKLEPEFAGGVTVTFTVTVCHSGGETVCFDCLF
jgi:hypothetical protein